MKIDFFWIWVLRSRGAALLALLILGAQHFSPAFAAWEYAGLMRLLSFALLFFGGVDMSGNIQKKKVLEAIKRRQSLEK
jgi:hypothetical protein